MNDEKITVGYVLGFLVIAGGVIAGSSLAEGAIAGRK